MAATVVDAKDVEMDPDASSSSELDEDAALCCVCLDGDSEAQNPIVFCDGCDMAVHMMCYGNPLIHGIPEGEWLCERCLWKAQHAECVLCPVKKGAMKRTTDAQWCHLSCALWTPEVFFQLGEAREPIDRFRIPLRRWEMTCDYCETSCGACTECSEYGCRATFHVACGLKQSAFFEYKESGVKGEPDMIVAFCAKHADEARRKRHWKMRFTRKKA